MGILQKKCRTTGKRPWRTGEKVAKNTGTAFPALRLGVVLYLLNRYRYRLEIRMNYHYRYRLGPRSRPLISIDSQLPSRKSFELISLKLPLPLPSSNVFELER